MSDHPEDSMLRRFRALVMGVVCFLGFGVLLWVVLGLSGIKSGAESKAGGEFDEATTEQRWANFEEVSAAQAALVNNDKIKASMAKVASNAAGPKKTDLVVPGSETFLKQAAAAAPAPSAEEAAVAPAAAETEKPAGKPSN